MIDRLLHISIIIIGIVGAFALARENEVSLQKKKMQVQYIDMRHLSYESEANLLGESRDDTSIDTVGQ